MSESTLPCCGDPDPCEELRKEIEEFIENLAKRFWDLVNDEGGLPLTRPSTSRPRYGYRSIEGEQHQFTGRQQGLRNRLDDWNSNGCGPPPPTAWEWATKEVPSPAPKSVDTQRLVETAAVGLGAAAIVYGTYRVVRLLPSLLPPLWWTLPANLAVP